ncbi:MAG: hypothetical protein KUG62_11300 [Rhodobacteraceae bacterium]|nr:hypothetical protein [Paracoccaceae bacterium]
MYITNNFCRLASVCLAALVSSLSEGYSQEAFDRTGLPDKLLEYTVGCALPIGTKVEIDGQVYQGSFGLAPAWQDAPLQQRERDLVSSCLLARFNALGVSVQISMRDSTYNQKKFPSLRANAAERTRFSLFEGAFYGDLFSEFPQAFVCLGDTSAGAIEALRQKQRLCSLAVDGGKPTGPAISVCGFIVTGSCSYDSVFTQNGRVFRDPVFVYLDPK